MRHVQRLNHSRENIKNKHLKYCFICLKTHIGKKFSYGAFKIYTGKHNTLLHLENFKEKHSSSNSSSQEPQSSSANTCNIRSVHSILSTAIVHFIDKSGHAHQCRVL